MDPDADADAAAGEDDAGDDAAVATVQLLEFCNCLN